MTLRSPSRTSRSILLLSSFFVSAGVCLPSLCEVRPEAEADCAASRVKSLAVSRSDEIRERDSIVWCSVDAGWIWT